jgi:hypothetical protein
MRLLIYVNSMIIYIYILQEADMPLKLQTFMIYATFTMKNAARNSIPPMHATCPFHLTLIHIVATIIYGRDAARTLTFSVRIPLMVLGDM